MKNRLKMKHIYLKWKSKLEAKVTQCSSGIQTSEFILKQSIPIYQTGNLQNKTGTAISAFFMCPKLALYVLNPHFSVHTSAICVKTVEA